MEKMDDIMDEVDSIDEFENLEEVYDKEDIEDEIKRISTCDYTCVKYIVQKYTQPICEDIIQDNSLAMCSVTDSYAVNRVDTIARKYLENTFVFEEQYFNHVVIMTDVLSKIGRSPNGIPYLIIGRGERLALEEGDNHVWLTAYCQLKSADEQVIKTVSQIKTGKKIGIVGVMRNYDINKFQLTDCIIYSYDHEVIKSLIDEATAIFINLVEKHNKIAIEENKNSIEKHKREKLLLEKQRKLEEEEQNTKKLEAHKRMVEKFKNICPQCHYECGKSERFCRNCGSGLESPYLKEVTQRLKDGLSEVKYEKSCYFCENIPQMVLDNAIKTYAQGVQPIETIALYDTSVMGKGKSGMLFTGENLYYKQTWFKPGEIKYSEIKSVNIQNKDVYVLTNDGKTHDFWDYGMESESFCKLLNSLLEIQVL